MKGKDEPVELYAPVVGEPAPRQEVHAT
jgi:hypothetical protein